MIAPLTKFPIRGAIWYQGEANAGRAWQYRTLLPAMIKCWRDAWGQGDFPFLIVQLAPVRKRSTRRQGADRKRLGRAARSPTVDQPKRPQLGLAVITDLGDERDIHPQRKRRSRRAAGPGRQGDRLLAKRRLFGPGVRKADHQRRQDHPEFQARRLRAWWPPTAICTGFAIAGEDKKFVNADAPRSRAIRSSSRAIRCPAGGGPLRLGQLSRRQPVEQRRPAGQSRSAPTISRRSRKTRNSRSARRGRSAVGASTACSAQLRQQIIHFAAQAVQFAAQLRRPPTAAWRPCLSARCAAPLAG